MTKILETSLWSEVSTQVRMALPIASVYLIQFLGMIISQIVAGHVSADALAAIALSNFWYNVCTQAPLVGLAFASDSLIPQAIGARNPVRAGVIAQRGVIALLGMSLLVLPLLLFAGDVFAVLGQQPSVVAIARSYVRWLAIGLPAMALFEQYKKLVNACHHYAAPVLIAASALGVQAVIAYVLVYAGGAARLGLEEDIDGVAIAFVISLWWEALGAVLHLATHRYWTLSCCRRKAASYYRGSETTPLVAGSSNAIATSTTAAAETGSSTSAPLLLQSSTDGAVSYDAHALLDTALSAPITAASICERAGVAEYLSAGLPSVAMMVLEWGSFEALAVIAGTIDAPTQAAHSVLGTLEFTFFAPVLGMSLGASLRAGSFMGARDPAAARHATRVTFGVILGYALCVAVFVGAAHAVIATIFTSDSDTAALITRWSPVLCGVFVFDALQGAAGGVLRGIGRPVVGALSSVVSYLFVGIPVSYVLAKVCGWGLPGLWAGIGFSVLVAFSIMGGTLATINWQAQSARVADAAEEQVNLQVA